jgi:phosphocarrier protein
MTDPAARRATNTPDRTRGNAGSPAPVGAGAIGASFLRLFAVQGSWNYETMIGNGIAFSMKPLLRGLPEERYRAAFHFCPLLGGSLMAERTVTILNENGVHARPAAEIVKTAGKFASNITIVRDDLEVNGKSIMGVMMLAAECGSNITLRATGADADDAVEALAQLVAARFGER